MHFGLAVRVRTERFVRDIRIIASEKHCQEYFDYVQEGKVYRLSGGRVMELAFQRDRKSKVDYEIVLTDDSVLKLCQDTDSCAAQFSRTNPGCSVRFG